MSLQDIRNLIAQGDTAGALKALVNLVQEGAWRNKRLRDDLLILSNQYEELKHKENIGLIDREESRHQSVQVNSALLHVIDEMETSKELAEEKPTLMPGMEKKERKKIPWWIVLVLLVPAVGFGVWKAFIEGDKAPATPPPGQRTEVESPPVVPPTQPVIAAFDWQCMPATCAAPCEIQFTNTSQNAERFLWDFGDGQATMERNPVHKYLKGKVYSVSLTAIGRTSDNIATQSIQILSPPPTNIPPAPVAMFHMDKQRGTVPCRITFSNLSEHADLFTWQIDNKTVGNTRDLQHTFTTPGSFNVKLIARRGSKQNVYVQRVQVDEDVVDPVARFTASRYECEKACRITFTNLSRNAERYSWTVDGKEAGQEVNLMHGFTTPGNHEVVLRAIRGQKENSYTRSIHVLDPNKKPRAEFSYARRTYTAPATILFANNAMNADRYQWEVNGRSVSAEKNLRHVFTTPGEYTVKLTVYQGAFSDVATQTIVINKSVERTEASFQADKTSCMSPCVVNFTNTSRNADRYAWYVNNTQVGTNTNLRYSFTKAGQYEVKLVAGSGAQQQTKIQTITIGNDISISFQADQTGCKAPCTILFTNKSQNAESFKWYVNNALVGNARDLRHTFSTAGTYTVKLYGYKGTASRYNELQVQITAGTPAVRINPELVKPNVVKPGVVKPKQIKPPN